MRRRYVQIGNYVFKMETCPPIRTPWEMQDAIVWYSQDVLPWLNEHFGFAGHRWSNGSPDRWWALEFYRAEDAFAFKMRWG